MHNFFLSFWLLGSILLVSGCQSSRPAYSKRARDWQLQFPSLPSKVLDYSVFLIGDAGEASSEPMEPNLKLLKSHLEAAGPKSAVIFLGDNLYPAGLPPEGDPFRAEAERRLRVQLDILQNFAGRPFVIPGNHDWNHWRPGGREAIRRQQEFVERYTGNTDIYYPGKGCGDPKAIELTDDLTLILIDSQWWLQDWDGEPEINKGCRIDDREDFEIALAELVDEYDDTNLLLCMHHPVYTTGGHGGYAALGKHIFPLTEFNPYLFVPLPVIGSLPHAARYLGVTTQDNTNRKNQDFLKDVLNAIFRVDNVVVASGHEHIAEYFSYDKENQHFIVTGSGCKSSFAKFENDSHEEIKTDFLFRKEAFTKLFYYQDGSVWMEFWAPRGEGNTGEVVFRKEIKAATYTVTDPVVAGDPAKEPPAPDSVEVVTSESFRASRLKRFWLGNQYRDAWMAPVKWPELDMSSRKGGLIPIKRGGGQATLSLRLQAVDGNQYVLRSVNKDATTYLPIFARNTLLDKIAQDQFSMGHPYISMVIPPLADAIGVYHTNPEFYFVPDQQNLGDFSSFSSNVFLFEERPAKDWSDLASFGNSDKIVSYRKMLHNVREEQDHRIDQESVLRTRLFDLLITDIDRHDDQFRWASFDSGAHTLYRPIPRDRDLAFLKFEGLIPWLISRKWSVARELHSFEPKFQDVVGTAKSGVHFDRSFLNGLDREDWRKISEEMKQDLGDSVVEGAFALLPDTLYRLDGIRMTATFKSRRDKLPEEAEKYYRFLSKVVDVVGTDDRERFQVTRNPDGSSRVEVYTLSKKKGKKKELYYERTFLKEETREIRLFGLKDEDEFEVTGEASSAILLRIIGGPGEDVIKDFSKVSGLGKRTRVYDTRREENVIDLGTEAKDLTSTHYEVNEYDRKSFKYPMTLPLVLPSFNPDDGFLLGLGLNLTRHGFRKDPFKSKQSLLGSYAFATQAFNIRYSSVFVETFGKWDFRLDAHVFNDNHVINYFPAGNETEYSSRSEDDFDFNRLRYSQTRVNPMLMRPFNRNREQFFMLGLQYERTEAERTTGRISATENDSLSGLSDADFSPKNYGSVKLAYKIDKKDHPFHPKRGLVLNFHMDWNARLDSLQSLGDHNFFQIKGDLAFYYTLPRIRTTLGIRGGGGINIGPYEFFQAQFLGRRNNLRGYRGERFAGDAAAFLNSDLRIDVLRIENSFIPMVIGVSGFFDMGRVWLEGENSNTWHPGYGGGVFVQPFDIALLNLYYAMSPEAQFIEFKLSFFF